MKKERELCDLRVLQSGRLSRRQLNTISVFGIPDTLRSRGFEWLTHGDLSETYLADDWPGMKHRDALKSLVEELEQLRKSSHRKARKAEFQGTCREDAYTRAIEALVGFLCVEHLGAFSAAFGVKIKGTPDGGDFDCLANFNGNLIAFEVKSGTSRNLDEAAAEHFLQRHQFLAPLLSVMLIDFDGVDAGEVQRLFKHRNLFAGQLGKILHISNGPETTHGKCNVFAVQHNIFVVDVVRGDMLRNLREVLKMYWRFRSFDGQFFFKDTFRPAWLGYEGSWI